LSTAPVNPFDWSEDAETNAVFESRVDGFFAGPNGELDWHIVDDEYNEWTGNCEYIS